LSDPYDPDRMFEEILKVIEDMLQGMTAQQVTVPRPEQKAQGEPDELVVGKDAVTYILHAPGYTAKEFLVSVLEDSVEVKTRDFLRRRPLEVNVDPASAKTTYNNGVLSISLRRVD
jgi:HSP20 family molecular chaperone IbpA